MPDNSSWTQLPCSFGSTFPSAPDDNMRQKKKKKKKKKKMPTKRSNANNLILCGAPEPELPDSSGDANKPSILKALEAVVAAGRRGLLGPAAMAAVEAMPDLNLELSNGELCQETPSPIPSVGEKKEEKQIVNKECGTVLAVMPPVEGVGSQQPRKEIWICGNSVISTSMMRAKNSSFGMQLGFPSSAGFVYWRGIPTMMWDELLPFLHQTYHNRFSPRVIVIHVGESDLLADSSGSLLTRMQNDLGILRRAFPDVVIIWSSLLPKRFWTPSERPQLMETKRNEVNCKMGKYCNGTGIRYLSHTLIVAKNQCLFKPDNTLSNAGADIFIVDLKLALNPHLVCNKS